MGSRDFYDIFNECVDRMAAGQSLEACLRLYPAEATRLRPLLEAGGLVRRLLPEAAEIRTDQAMVWGRIEPRLDRQRLNRRRKPGIGRLLLAAALLTGLLGGAYFALNRPQQDTNLIEPLVTTSPTHTYTATPTFTFTPTLTHTPSPMPSATPSDTPSPVPSVPATLMVIPTVPPPTSTPLLPTLVPTIRTDNSGPGSVNSGSGSDDDSDDDNSGSGDDDDNSGHGSSDDGDDD